MSTRPRQVAILGSAELGTDAWRLAGAAGELLARCGVTVVSGCGSPATRFAAERARAAGGLVVAVVPEAEHAVAEENLMGPGPELGPGGGVSEESGLPCSVLIPCGMGDARNLLMALAGDAAIVIGGRAGTISEVALAWLHRRPLLPLVGYGGYSDRLQTDPPDERGNSRILPWSTLAELVTALGELGLPVSPPPTGEAARSLAAAEGGWRCGKCGEAVPASFEICWCCGSSRLGVEDPSFRAKAVEDQFDPQCTHCGYSLIGLLSNRCPECGEEVERPGGGASR